MALLAACSVFHQFAAGQYSGLSEYEIKAAMLYNFAKFVEFPATPGRSAGGPLILGILGRDPFGPALDAVLRDKTISDRPVVVRRFAEPVGLDSCQVLFIAASEKDHLAELLPAVRRRGLLTVSDIPGFARSGGVIGFTLDAKKVRFEINPEAARRANLTVSSKLLKLATIVGDSSRKGG